MAKKVLRMLKTGGCSYCSSPEELVGKGRCKHIPGMSFKQEVVNGLSCVEITSFEDSNNNNLPSAKVDVHKLDEYVSELDNRLTAEKKQSIIKFFESYN